MATELKEGKKTAAKAAEIVKSESCCAGEAQAFNPVAGSICHVEFTVPDLEKSSKFYGEVFGWQFMPFAETEMYFQTPKNAGPCGCILKGAAETEGKTTFYVNVQDIPAILKKCEKLGARTLTPKTEIPGGHGYMAKFVAPEGNIIGIYSR